MPQTDSGVAPQALQECLESASAEIEFYCPQYTSEALAESRWVQSKCTDLAVYFLCLLKLNPVEGAIAELYQHTIDQLTAVRSGSAVIPGAPIGRNGQPLVSNYRVELNRHPSVRVDRPRTTGPVPEGYPQRPDGTADQAVR